MEQNELVKIQKRLSAARGDTPADLLLRDVRLVNVLNNRIEDTNVAIFDGIIIGFGDYQAREVFDLDGAYLAPGLIESHIHIESSKLTPDRFSETVLPHGTTTVIADPHEIANVLGIEGIKLMMRSSRNSTIDVFYMLPSCVPATDMETSGAILTADDLEPLLQESDVIGIGELMNYPGAFLGDAQVLKKALLVGRSCMVDGHAPGLMGTNLFAYLIAGPSTDHECTTLEEAREKLSAGVRILIRQGSTAKNFTNLAPLITPATERRITLVSDDIRSGDLIERGHIDNILREAVSNGVDPVTALRMVTLNPAEIYRLDDRGSLRPGAIADLVAFDDLQSFNVRWVWKNGQLVAIDGEINKSITPPDKIIVKKSIVLPDIQLKFFEISDKGLSVRIIEIVPDQIITKSLITSMPSVSGCLVPDIDRDIIKIAVIDRHSGNGNMTTGFVRGFGIKNGAIGSTVAHDSHNIIVAGTDDISLFTAVNELKAMGGGQVAVSGEFVEAKLPLPVGGLMTETDANEVALREELLISAARRMGCALSDPFMALSFLALPVIPELKITDKGLVDVIQFKLVSLYADE